MTAQSWRALLSRRYDTPNQAPMTRWVSQRLGSLAAAAAFRLRLSPNAVTLAGLVVALLGCVPYTVGSASPAWIAAAVLWQLAFALDCADGQLARATARTSRFGAWLDVACDHVRQSALVVSIFVVLHAELGAAIAALCTLTLASGLSVYLHTATFVTAAAPAPLSLQSTAAVVRTVLRVLLDAPVLLALLCILRPWPAGLAAFAGSYGALLLMRSAGIGRLRLRP